MTPYIDLAPAPKTPAGANAVEDRYSHALPLLAEAGLPYFEAADATQEEVDRQAGGEETSSPTD